MIQSVVFTFLPQDSAPFGEFAAAVFLSPRLTPDEPDTRAGDFDAFRDLPAVVRDATIVVERGDGATIERRADPAPLRSDLWRTYLAPIPVRGWSYHDLSSTRLRSFDAQWIHALARGLYHAV